MCLGVFQYRRFSSFRLARSGHHGKSKLGIRTMRWYSGMGEWDPAPKESCTVLKARGSKRNAHLQGTGVPRLSLVCLAAVSHKNLVHQDSNEKDLINSWISRQVRTTVLSVAPAFKSAIHLHVGSYMAQFSPAGARWSRLRCPATSVAAEQTDPCKTRTSRGHFHSLGDRSIPALRTVSDGDRRCCSSSIRPGSLLDHSRTRGDRR